MANKEQFHRQRLRRRIVVALLFVIIYIKHANFAIGYISQTNIKESYNPNEDAYLQGELQRLQDLPKDSVHRVAFVTFSFVKFDDTRKLFDFILPAVDTWAGPQEQTKSDADVDVINITRSNNNSTSVEEEADHDDDDSSYTLPSIYVVFTQDSREPFERHCIHGETANSGNSNNFTVEQLTALCHRIQPIFVDCPEGRFGESPCCKQQKGLLTLYQSRNYPLYDWYAFFDDDIYLRKEYIARILPAIQVPAEEGGPDFAMAAIPYSQDRKVIGFGPDRICGPKGDLEFSYPWGQPIFYTRGALAIMAKGYRADSLLQQCAAFRITHDVGNAMLNWMYRLPVARLPPLNPLPDFRGDFIGSHWAGREDMRESLYGVDKKDRKGRVTKALPKGAFSFYEVQRRWNLRHNQPPDDVNKLSSVNKPELRWYNRPTWQVLPEHAKLPAMAGFLKTKTYAQYGDPQSWEEGVWHTMNLWDCPGALPKFDANDGRGPYMTVAQSQKHSRKL